MREGVPVDDDVAAHLASLRAENEALRTQLGLSSTDKVAGSEAGALSGPDGPKRQMTFGEAQIHMRAESPWVNHSYQIAQANKHHIEEAILQGYTRDFVQSVMQNFFEAKPDRAHTEISLDELEVRRLRPARCTNISPKRCHACCTPRAAPRVGRASA